MEDIDRKKVKGCELLIPTRVKNKIYSIKIDESDSISGKRGDRNLYAFKSDLATTNYMRYYTASNMTRRLKFPDILHIWSIRKHNLTKNNANKYLRTINILQSMTQTNSALDHMLNKGKMFGLIKTENVMKIFKYFNDQQSFSQIDIFFILRQQIKTILNMAPKNFEFMNFGREYVGLFTPIE